MTLNAKRTFLATCCLAAATAALTLCLGTGSAFAVTSAEKQAEADEIAANIDALQTKLNQARQDYDDASAKHEEALANAEAAAERAAAADAETDDLQSRLGTRVVDMYKSGGYVSYLDVLMGSSSFNEFLTTWDACEALNDQDAALVEKSKAAHEEAEAARAEYEEQSETAQKEMDRAEQAQQEIEATQASMQKELEKVNEEVVKLQAKEEAERIAKEEAEKRKKEAEEAAERARQRAAQSAASSSEASGDEGSYDASEGSESSSGSGGASISGWTNPLPDYYGVTNEFAWAGAWDGQYHNGIDLGASRGTPIYSCGSGTVSYVGDYGSGGQAVKVSHGNGVVSIYMHMDRFGTTMGSEVQAGDLVGYVGMTGYTTGPHLHFQIEVDGTPVNPRNYFSF